MLGSRHDLATIEQTGKRHNARSQILRQYGLSQIVETIRTMVWLSLEVTWTIQSLMIADKQYGVAMGEKDLGVLPQQVNWWAHALEKDKWIRSSNELVAHYCLAVD